MQFARNFLLLTLALGAAACTSDDLGPSSPVIPPLAYVRYIHALPDTFATTVRWIDDIEFTPQTFVGVAFRAEGQGGFQGLRAGSRTFRIFTYQQNVLNFPIAGNTTMLNETTFDFVAGQYYTIIHTGFTRTGSTPAAQVRILVDNPPAQPAAGTLVRVVNLAYTGNWDLYVGAAGTQVGDTSTASATYTAAPGVLAGSTTAAAAGSFATLPNYAALALGTYQARFTSAGTLTRPGTAATPTPVRVTIPAGLAETSDFEAAGGSNVAGSVLTMWVFGAQTGGTGAASRPSVLVTVDRSPARTVAP